MELLAVSKDAIRAHVIRYFHDVFHIPISELKPNTDVHHKLPITEKAWRNLANVFNSLSWMKQLGVLLSPREMPGLNTIDDIVNAIWGKLNKVISVTGLSTRLQASGVRKFAAPRRRSAPKPKRKAAAKSKRKPGKRTARKKPTR